MSTQLSYISGTSSKPLLGICIGDMLDESAQRFPQQDALIVLHQNIRFTYQEFQAKVEECARAFMALGVQKRDRVGIWSPNRHEWTITQFATAKIGAILVNINPSYRKFSDDRDRENPQSGNARAEYSGTGFGNCCCC